ncbi:MAG: rod-binding protein [Thermodesulfobacteriota bacterium]
MKLSIDFRTVSSTTQSPGLSAVDRQNNLESLRQSCREFEAIYVAQMYKAMRNTIPQSGLFEKDMASELYKEMLDMEMARQTAEGDGTGIGEAMYRQLTDHNQTGDIHEE